MSEKFIFKTAVLGGLKKTEVLEYVEAVTNQVTALQEKIKVLENENDILIERNQKLQLEVEAYEKRKESLIQLEMDAQERAKMLVYRAKKQSDHLMRKAEVKIGEMKIAQERSAADMKAQLAKNIYDVKVLNQTIEEQTILFAEKNQKMKESIQKTEILFGDVETMISKEQEIVELIAVEEELEQTTSLENQFLEEPFLEELVIDETGVEEKQVEAPVVENIVEQAAHTDSATEEQMKEEKQKEDKIVADFEIVEL